LSKRQRKKHEDMRERGREREREREREKRCFPRWGKSIKNLQNLEIRGRDYWSLSFTVMQTF
jgi:hypothetical protein